MDDLVKQALDLVFNNTELKTKVKKEATPYVLGVFTIYLFICFALVYLISQVTILKRIINSSQVGSVS